MFFQLQQQQGQDEREFLESLKAAANEADIEGMSVHDALCLALVSGLRDTKLREKLSELEDPSLPSFSALIDAHMHSKATAGQSAVGNRTAGQNQNKKINNNKSGSAANKGPSEAEKKRRAFMKGKCFRCGSAEHFANACNLAKDIKCRKCGATGHIVAACAQGQARASEENQQVSSSGSLAIEYQGSPEYAQASVAQARYVGKDNNSFPTPPALL